MQQHRFFISKALMYLIKGNSLLISKLYRIGICQGIEALKAADAFLVYSEHTFINKSLQDGAVGIGFCEQIGCEDVVFGIAAKDKERHHHFELFVCAFCELVHQLMHLLITVIFRC